MSRNYNNKSSIKAHCKVCQDAGKTEAEYSSHFTRETRDPNSRVICPTLLDLKCRYCFNTGHTVKYCKELKKKERTTEHQNRPSEAPKKATGKNNNPNNIFLVLDSEDESEDDNKPVMKKTRMPELQEQFPAMSASKPIQLQSVSTSYADILTKPVEAKVQQVPRSVPASKAPRSAPWASKVTTTTPTQMNWADCVSDSEDEEYAEVEDNSAW